MSAPIYITVRGDLLKRLPALASQPALAARLARAMDQQNLYTVSHIQRDYLNFPRQGPTTLAGLRNVTGSYFRSLRASPAQTAGGVIASEIGTNVKSRAGVSYPAVHEFGATIPPHRIMARNAKSLRFIGRDGKVIFRRAVNVRHPVTLPAREPIQRGIRDRLEQYNAAFNDAIEQWLNSAN